MWPQGSLLVVKKHGFDKTFQGTETMAWLLWGWNYYICTHIYIYICYLFGLPRKKMGVQKNPLFGLGGEAVVRCPFEVGGVSEEKKNRFHCTGWLLGCPWKLVTS